jgi:methanogenic corrinoid protein MtbC1/DNA-binding XRE family transcriptional regulator
MTKISDNDLGLIYKLQKRLLDYMKIGDSIGSIYVIDEALSNNLRPSEIYINIIGKALDEVGKLWHQGVITVAHEHLSSQMAAHLIEIVYQKSYKLSSNGFKAVVTTPVGEKHWVGAKMFANLLLLNGWKVDYLGTETPAKDLSEYVYTSQIDIVAISSILDTNMETTLECIDYLNNLEVRPFIFVGGPIIKDKTEGFENVFIVGDIKSAIEKVEIVMGLSSNKISLSEILLSIGNQIQDVRKSQGLNQEQLAELASVDRAYISLVENGKQNFTMGALLKLSESLDVTLASLIK